MLKLHCYGVLVLFAASEKYTTAQLALYLLDVYGVRHDSCSYDLKFAYLLNGLPFCFISP
jgi:hypothetical protein